MKNIVFLIFVLSFINLFFFQASAQIHDFGSESSISLSKKINRFVDLSVEQAVRFDQVSTSFNRSATSVDADIDLIRKFLRAEIGYDFLYRKDDDAFYELRHRTSFGFLVKKKVVRFQYRFRTRIQSTYRDENRGDHAFNPRISWRNKLEVRYDIFGSPFKPYLNGELFCPVNSDHGFYLNGYRISMGTKYQLTKRSELNLKIFFDQDVQRAYPANILYCCIGWDYEL